MKKTAFISDILFTLFSVALGSLCVFRYLRLRLIPACFLALVCGVLSACAMGAFLHAKRQTAYLKRSDESQKQKLLLHLALLSDEAKTRLFAPLLHAVRRGKLRLQTPENYYFLRFSFAPVTADEVATLSRFKTAGQKTLVCSEIEDSAKNLCKRLGVETQTGDQVYALFKRENALPERYLGEETPETRKKRLIRVCFAKSNAKRFLLSATLLLLTSLITPFPTYYLLFGFILLATAILVRIFGK